jgi:hypothetical protein
MAAGGRAARAVFPVPMAATIANPTQTPDMTAVTTDFMPSAPGWSLLEGGLKQGSDDHYRRPLYHYI